MNGYTFRNLRLCAFISYSDNLRLFLLSTGRKEKRQYPYYSYPRSTEYRDSTSVQEWDPSTMEDLSVQRLTKERKVNKAGGTFFNSIHGYIPKILADKKVGFKPSKENKFITYINFGKQEGSPEPDADIRTVISVESQDPPNPASGMRHPHARPRLDNLVGSPNIYSTDPTIHGAVPSIIPGSAYSDPAYESLYPESLDSYGPPRPEDYVEHSPAAILTTDRSKLVPQTIGKRHKPEVTFM